MAKLYFPDSLDLSCNPEGRVAPDDGVVATSTRELDAKSDGVVIRCDLFDNLKDASMPFGTEPRLPIDGFEISGRLQELPATVWPKVPEWEMLAGDEIGIAMGVDRIHVGGHRLVGRVRCLCGERSDDHSE